MGTASSPQPVKLLVGLLAREEAWLAAAERRLSEAFGAIDLASTLIPFDFTHYYTPEMGGGLLRKFITHNDFIAPGALAAIKTATNAMEAALAKELGAEVARPVNLDPGYLDASRLVLATTKDRAHRIYLARGIYAEVTLTWHKAAWRPTPWTYRDYQSDPYLAFFTEARARYLEQRRGDA